MKRKLPWSLFALSLSPLWTLLGTGEAAVVHQFDWSTGAEDEPWDDPPWIGGIATEPGSFTNVGGTGRIFNGGTLPVFTHQVLIHEFGVEDDTNPGTLLDMSLVTFSMDVMRDGSVTAPTDNGLGFYAYDLVNAFNGLDQADQIPPNTTNDGVLWWSSANEGVNTNFMSPILLDNPDQWFHVDIVVNGSGADVGNGVDDVVPDLHWMAYVDGEPVWDNTNADILLASELVQQGTGGYARGVEGEGVDTWGFRSFFGGAWHIDNFTVRDEYFVQQDDCTLTGDYNENCQVDAPDYNVWRDSFGDQGEDLPADGNGNGQIDAPDYNIWRDNFGAVGGAGLVTAGVPEPSTIVMTAIGLLAAALRYRRSSIACDTGTVALSRE